MDFETRSGLLFEEVQRFRDVLWIRMLLLLCMGAPTVAVLWGIYQQEVLGKPFGDQPMPTWGLVLTGLGLLLLFWGVMNMNLTVRVDSRGLHIRYAPFVFKHYVAVDLAAFESCTYRPIRDYGGWGIRYGLGQGWCYNVHGNRGAHRFAQAVREGGELLLHLGVRLELGQESRKAGIAGEPLLDLTPGRVVQLAASIALQKLDRLLIHHRSLRTPP